MSTWWQDLLQSLLAKPSTIPGVPVGGFSLSTPIPVTGYVNPMIASLARTVAVGTPMLGRPYRLGAKWDVSCAVPFGPVDCSGFVRWCYWQGAQLAIPDGSEQQYEASMAVASPWIGDLGFFRAGGVSHHVGLLAGDVVLEARGDPYNQVITRPRSAWEAWREFSGWRRMRAAL